VYTFFMPRRWPRRYVPPFLSPQDQQKQSAQLMKSKKAYKKQQYYNRRPIAAYKTKRSKHISRALKLYHLSSISPNAELAKKTGCTLAALRKIVQKGEGAYYSSGSRPNQTPQSWGLARLASALTAGKAAAVDFDILKKGCRPQGLAFKKATLARRQYKFGHGKTKKIKV
jgi:hypothetical protein